MPQSQQEALIQAVLHIEDLKDARELTRLLQTSGDRGP
jgi:hypothetical protein